MQPLRSAQHRKYGGPSKEGSGIKSHYHPLKYMSRTLLVVQESRLLSSTTGGVGLIPDQGNYTCHAVHPKQNKMRSNNSNKNNNILTGTPGHAIKKRFCLT